VISFVVCGSKFIGFSFVIYFGFDLIVFWMCFFFYRFFNFCFDRLVCFFESVLEHFIVLSSVL